MVISALLLAFALGLNAQGQCLSASPGTGWVCQDGGWLPPGHPDIRPTTQPPVTTTPPIGGGGVPPAQGAGNDWILQRLASGQDLPEGVVYFTAPLVIYDIPRFSGVLSRTILKPLGSPAGPLLVVMSNMPGEFETGYPRLMHLRDFRLDCTNLHQTGIVINGAAITFERVIVTGCGDGVRFDWAVNVRFVDSRFVKSTNGWVIPAGAVATTIRCSGCSFSYHTLHAIYSGTVQGLLLDQWTIIEYNPAIGLYADCGSRAIVVRDSWFEGNRQHTHDACRVIRWEGATEVRE